MSKRRKAARAAKAKRQQAARRADWWRHWPYFAVGGVAVALVAALFLVSTGGEPSSSEVQASYPVGYTPPTDGDESAPVEFVMWADYQCPFCGRFEEQTLPELRQRYVETGKMKFVWRNFENYGSESQDSAVAAHCAGEQDKFWEYHDMLYVNQRGINTGAFTTSNLLRFASELGLERAPFETCLGGAGLRRRDQRRQEAGPFRGRQRHSYLLHQRRDDRRRSAHGDVRRSHRVRAPRHR